MDAYEEWKCGLYEVAEIFFCPQDSFVFDQYYSEHFLFN